MLYHQETLFHLGDKKKFFLFVTAYILVCSIATLKDIYDSSLSGYQKVWRKNGNIHLIDFEHEHWSIH